MADFTIDSAAFESWASTLQNSVEYTSQAKNNLVDMQGAVKDLTEQFSALNIGKDFINGFKEIQGMFKDVSASLSEFSSGLQNLGISNEIKKQLDAILKTINETKKATDKNTKDAKKAQEDNKMAIAHWAGGLAGIQLSLTGVLSLLLDIANESRRIEAYSARISAQMGGNFPANIAKSRDLLQQMQKNFALTYDEAATHLHVLAQTGMEMDMLNNSALEMYSIQALGGLSIQEQAVGVNRLMTEFNLSGKAARDYNTLLHESAKTMEGLSISTVAADWTEMKNSIAGYNTDLLGTISLYNVLARDEVAKKIGLGGVPQEVRRDLAKAASGFGKDMELGWKAFLGGALGKDFKALGASLSENIIKLETLSGPELLERAIAGAKLLSEQSGKSMYDSMLNMRLVFADMGLDAKTVARSLANATVSGELNMSALKDALENGRKQAEEDLAKADDARDALVNLGSTVATGLVSLEEKLKQWVKNSLRPLVRDLINALDRLSSAAASAVASVKSFFNIKTGEQQPAESNEFMKTIPEYKSIADRMQEKAALGKEITPKAREVIMKTKAYKDIKKEFTNELGSLGFSKTDIEMAALGSIRAMIPYALQTQLTTAKNKQDIANIKIMLQKYAASFNPTPGSSVRSVAPLADMEVITGTVQEHNFHAWGMGKHPRNAQGEKINYPKGHD